MLSARVKQRSRWRQSLAQQALPEHHSRRFAPYLSSFAQQRRQQYPADIAANTRFERSLRRGRRRQACRTSCFADATHPGWPTYTKPRKGKRCSRNAADSASTRSGRSISQAAYGTASKSRRTKNASAANKQRFPRRATRHTAPATALRHLLQCRSGNQTVRGSGPGPDATSRIQLRKSLDHAVQSNSCITNVPSGRKASRIR